MSRFIKNSNSNDTDNIYYNVDIINGRTTSTGSENDPIASFYEARDTPIISDISQYKMSVIRFTMDGMRDLPLFIPKIENNQPNPNKTVYKITMVSQNVSESMSVIFAPELQDTLLLTSQENQTIENEYYWVHTYSHFVKLINKTFLDLTTLINNQVVNDIVQPKMIYNPSNKKFDLYHPKANVKIYFDSNLYNLISHYPGKKSINDDLLYYEIDPINVFGLNGYPADNPLEDYIKVEQEKYSVGTFWSPIASIVFTTNMPIISEGVAPPLVYGGNNINTSVGSNTNFENIITDIALSTDDAYDYKQFVSYVPNEYRFINLENSQTPLNSLSIKVFWKSRLTSQLIPLKLSNLSNISMKFLFTKK